MVLIAWIESGSNGKVKLCLQTEGTSCKRLCANGRKRQFHLVSLSPVESKDRNKRAPSERAVLAKTIIKTAIACPLFRCVLSGLRSNDAPFRAWACGLGALQEAKRQGDLPRNRSRCHSDDLKFPTKRTGPYIIYTIIYYI